MNFHFFFLSSGRFVDTSGITLNTNTRYALSIPWPCASCNIYASYVVLPLASCGASTVSVVITPGKFSSDSTTFTQFTTGITASIAVTSLMTAYQINVPASWTFQAPSAANQQNGNAGTLGFTISISSCVVWGTGITSASSGLQFLSAPLAGGNFEVTAEMGGIFVAASAMPSNDCPPSPTATASVSNIPVPTYNFPSTVTASPVLTNGASGLDSNSNGLSSTSSSSSKLSGGAIAGIVVGSVVGVALLAAGGYSVTRRMRASGASQTSSGV
jgi:hypothetical protein